GRSPCVTHAGIEHPCPIAIGIPSDHGISKAVGLPNVTVARSIEVVAVVVQVLETVAMARADADILRIGLAVVLALLVPVVEGDGLGAFGNVISRPVLQIEGESFLL